MTEDLGIIVVLLRRPRRAEGEMRSDPFYEFGSFGCTKCHHKNLLNPGRSDEVEGKRLAFAQGGPEGFRLVHLTPPVKIVRHGEFREACWKPVRRPFRYGDAPLLISNDGDGKTAFPELRAMLKGVHRSKWEGRFASRFRSRREPLPFRVSREIARKWDAAREKAKSPTLARHYNETLPYDPPVVDNHREKTYRKKLKTLNRPGC